VRHAEAPGEMGERGGSHGGLGLVDAKGTVPGEFSGTDRNLPPIGRVGEAFGRQGLDSAWKHRR
jgi:hypothetical protein